MPTIIEAIFENGVLKPLDIYGLREHQHYRLIVETLPEPELPSDPTLTTELEHRTTILPDGRQIVNLLGLFDQGQNGLSFETIETILDEARQEQRQEWNELYGEHEV